MSGAARQMMLCRVGTTICALDLEHVVEILRPLPLRPMAAMPQFVIGVSILRGAPVPIVDARLLLGAATDAPPRRVVSLSVDGRAVGLAVDEVVGVGTPAPGLELPPLLRDARADFVATLGRLDSELLVVLRAARLVPADEACA